MNKILDLIDKFKNNTANWMDYSEFLNIQNKDLESFFDIAQKIKKENFGNVLKIYIPNKRFPPISITGNKCDLHCEHCNKKYLNGMKPIVNNQDLERFLIDHYEKGGIGALISGGCLPDGSVPLLGFLDTIRNVKDRTELILNVHTGLLNEETAKKLKEAKVDIISFDINVDPEVIQNIYHLNKDLTDYKKAINILKKNNLNIVPHICFGLHYGTLNKELDSLKLIKETQMNPSLIVLIVLIPPKGSKLSFKIPNPYDIAKLITLMRIIFPKAEISLGCMRPKGKIREEIEKYAIKAGITRIEIPLKHTYKWILEEYPKIDLRFFSACCSIPKKFEEKARMNKLDLKRYLGR
ncbi:MAG: radical SAM protein [Candidatus Lokiarchaeota archaeon]|nr:radical SAM protein [Candidatus Lokiarchaeota archaeon]